MPPGICPYDTNVCSGLHGPCGAGAVLAATLLPPLLYSTRYFCRYVLYWADISPTGPGITGVAAPGLLDTQDPPFPEEFQYSYLVTSGTNPSGTRARYAEPPRPAGVPNEYM